MRIAFLAMALAFSIPSVSAQDQKQPPSSSSVSVLIDGRPLKGQVLEVDGKHYVAVEDLAQSLHGTIRYGDGEIALTLSRSPSNAAPPIPPKPPSSAAQPSPPQPLPPAAAEQTGTGRITGTLTYFFDFHTGSKPDAGSKLWLAKDRVDLPPEQAFAGTSTALGTAGNPEQYSAIKYAVADENGNFELVDVPPGSYTLILKSAHTKGALKAKTSIFGKGKPDLRDNDGRVEFLSLSVKAGDTVDASKDFGPDSDR